jgi:Transposase
MGRKHGERGESRKSKEVCWRRWLKLQASSGLNIREFCRQHNLGERAFYRWRKELLNQKEASKIIEASREIKLPLFAEVKLLQPTCVPIEIVLTDARRVIVPSGFDRESLQAVLEILERPTC